MGRPKGSTNKNKIVEEEIEKADISEIEETIANVPDGTIPEENVKETERKFSDENDQKGPFHPLCLICGHREDMHHTWKYFQAFEKQKNMNGVTIDVLVNKKDPIIEDRRPCQHACKCTDYK